MADEIEKISVGLKADKKNKLQAWKDRVMERARGRGKLAREQARADNLISSTVVAAIGGTVSEVVRRKVVGAATKEARTQGIGLIVVGLLGKVGAKYARIPMLGRIAEAHISQGAQVATMQTFYGDDDAMVVAIEGTSHKAVKDSAGG